MSLPDSVEEDVFASTTNCAVNNHEQDRVDTEGTCLTTEEPEVLTLDTELEKLTPKRFKVKITGSNVKHRTVAYLAP